MSKGVKEFEEYLNDQYDVEQVIDLTEHCWDGNDKTKMQKKRARNLAEQRKYGTVLRRYDTIAFNVAFNDWKREQTT